MKLNTKQSFDTPELRRNFAKRLSGLMMGRESNDLPYNSNEHDDYQWVIDGNNDWFLHFPEENNGRWTFSIRYRYNRADHNVEEIFAKWLEVKLVCNIVKESN